MKSQYYIIVILVVLLSFPQMLSAQDPYIIGPSRSNVGKVETYYLIDRNNQVDTDMIEWYGDGVLLGDLNGLSIQVYGDDQGLDTVGVDYSDNIGESHSISIDVFISDEAISLTSSSLNYIKTVIPREPTTNVSALNDSQKTETIAYYDGLGKLRQKVDKQAGGNLEDIITPVVYDDFGRQTKDYLPYVRSSGNPSLDYEPQTDDFFDELNNQYQEKYPDDFTSTTPNPYSEKVIEASQLNRILEQGAPGSDWQVSTPYHYGQNIKFDYQTNTTNEVRQLYVVHPAGNKSKTTLILNGYYESNELYKTITKDENWVGGINELLVDEKYHTTEEFKNKQGQVILKRTYADTGESEVPHDTYYIYDTFGNLTYVLPPKFNIENAAAIIAAAAIADGNDGVIVGYGEMPESELTELCYQYKYDNRNRLIEKKIPGKDPECIVYNNLDQPILTQDAIQKTNGEWLFTKYDAFGRVAYTGKATSANTTTREAVQTEVNAFVGNLWVTQGNSATNYGGVNMFYNNGAYPTTGALVTLSEILTINYYDTYVDRPTGAPTSVVLMESSPSETNATNVKGLATVSKVKVLDVTGANVWINTLTYYDSKSRPIYTYSDNTYLGTVDIVETKLDFIGNPLKSKTTHTRNGVTIATIDNYTYDHTGRLLTQTQCIGDQTLGYTCPGSSASVIDLALTGNITTNQVASKSIIITNGTIVPNTRLWISPEVQEVIADNTYDEFGQLESKGVGGKILNANRLQAVDYTYNVRGWLKQINDPTNLGNDLFSFKINYNTNNHGATNLYNGNISETEWRTANTDNSLKWYKYNYDALNRITMANDNLGNYDVYGILYDKNGNITNLRRDGWQNTTSYYSMDNLVYTYDVGNKLQKVLDNGNDNYGFKDDVNQTTEYTYDTNGNMLRDYNKGISSNITYNHLNLPTNVPISGGNISYIYDATGVKLKKVVSTGATTEYAGNYIYKEDKLKFFNHAEGYVEPKNELDLSQGFNYVYQYKDHLGNVRLSYADNDENGSITASTEILEENNYYPFGLRHKGYNNNPVTNHKYELYNGVEFEEALGLDLYEMDFRSYDPAIARFTSIDPVTHFSQSTYNAFDNNPVYWADPSGADAINGEMVGADGLTNSQWMEMSRPGGGGFDAMRQQASANTAYLNEKRLNSSLKVGPLQQENNGLKKIGEGIYYNSFYNLYITVNNKKKLDSDVYLKFTGELSIGPQTKDGYTVFGVGPKTSIGVTAIAGSIEVMTNLDMTVVNISHVNDLESMNEMIQSSTLTIDINKGFFGGFYERDARGNVEYGGNVSLIELRDGNNGSSAALQLLSGNKSFGAIGSGVDQIGVSGNLKIIFESSGRPNHSVRWQVRKRELERRN